MPHGRGAGQQPVVDPGGGDRRPLVLPVAVERRSDRAAVGVGGCADRGVALGAPRSAGRRGELPGAAEHGGRVDVAREVDLDRLGVRGATELVQQGAGGGPAARVRVHRRADERREHLGHAVEVGPAVHEPVQHRLGASRAVRGAPGRGEGHRRPPGVQVDGLGHGGARHLLGGEVPGSADDQAAAGEGRDVGGDGQAEVDDVRLAVQDQDVAGRQVAVHHALGVQHRQRVGQPPGEDLQRRHVERSVAVDQVVQPGAGHEPGDQVGQVGVDVGVEHLHQVGTTDPAQRLELVAEATAGVGVAEPVAQDLDRHGPVVLGDAEEHRAHAALSEPTEQAVRTDPDGIGVAQRRDRHRASRARTSHQP